MPDDDLIPASEPLVTPAGQTPPGMPTFSEAVPEKPTLPLGGTAAPDLYSPPPEQVTPQPDQRIWMDPKAVEWLDQNKSDPNAMIAFNRAYNEKHPVTYNGFVIDVLPEAERPGRFTANLENAAVSGPIGIAARGALKLADALAPGTPPEFYPPKLALQWLDQRRLKYELVPGWEGAGELMSAVGGSLVGSALDPLNYILYGAPIFSQAGGVVTQMLGGATQAGIKGVAARAAGGAAGYMAGALALNPIMQWSQIKVGLRQDYSNLETVGAVLSAGVLGAGQSLAKDAVSAATQYVMRHLHEIDGVVSDVNVSLKNIEAIDNHATLQGQVTGQLDVRQPINPRMLINGKILGDERPGLIQPKQLQDQFEVRTAAMRGRPQQTRSVLVAQTAPWAPSTQPIEVLVNPTVSDLKKLAAETNYGVRILRDPTGNLYAFDGAKTVHESVRLELKLPPETMGDIWSLQKGKLVSMTAEDVNIQARYPGLYGVKEWLKKMPLSDANISPAKVRSKLYASTMRDLKQPIVQRAEAAKQFQGETAAMGAAWRRMHPNLISGEQEPLTTNQPMGSRTIPINVLGEETKVLVNPTMEEAIRFTASTQYKSTRVFGDDARNVYLVDASKGIHSDFESSLSSAGLLRGDMANHFGYTRGPSYIRQLGISPEGKLTEAIESGGGDMGFMGPPREIISNDRSANRVSELIARGQANVQKILGGKTLELPLGEPTQAPLPAGVTMMPMGQVAQGGLEQFQGNVAAAKTIKGPSPRPAMPGEQFRPPQGIPSDLPTSVPSVALDKRSIGLRDVLVDVADVLQANQLKGGTKRGNLGQYDFKSWLIRIKNPNDLAIRGHEIGHHGENMLGDQFRTLITSRPEFETELRGVVQNLNDQGFGPYNVDKDWAREGFADLFRMVVQNPQQAQTMAPQFYSAFRQYLTNANPKLLSTLDDAASKYTRLITQPSGNAVDAFVVPMQTGPRPIGSQGLEGTISHQTYTQYWNLLDSDHPLHVITRNMQRALRNKMREIDPKALPDVPMAQDAWRMKAISKGAVEKTIMDLNYGMTATQGAPGQVTTPSMNAIVTQAQGQATTLSRYDPQIAHDFSVYAQSKNQLERWDRFLTGQTKSPRPPTTVLTQGDFKLAAEELEKQHPQFVKAYEMLQQWVQGFRDKAYENGIWSKEMYDAYSQAKNYVPALRDFSDELKLTKLPGGKVRLDLPGWNKRFLGSDRATIDPIQSLAMMQLKLNTQIEENLPIRALADLQQRLNDAGVTNAGRFFVEDVTNQVKGTKVNLLDAIKNFIKLNPDHPEAAMALRDQLMDMNHPVLVDMFKVGPRKLMGGEQALAYLRDGDVHILKIMDKNFSRDLMQVFNNVPVGQRDLLYKALGWGASINRMGITTVGEYGAANAMRDTMEAFLYQREFLPIIDTLKGAWHVLTKDKWEQAFERTGGAGGGYLTQNMREAMRKASVNEMAEKGYTTYFTTFDGIKEGLKKALVGALEISESASRVQLFKNAYERNIDKLGMDNFNALKAAGFEATDFLNWGRNGRMMQALRHAIAFLGSNVQGPDRAARTMLVPIARFMRGDILTQQEQRQLPDALISWAKLGALMVGTYAYRAAWGNDPRYSNLPANLRNQNWILPLSPTQEITKDDGTKITVPKDAVDVVAAIPMPHVFSAFISMGSLIWEAQNTQDSTIKQRTFENFLNAATLPWLYNNPAFALPWAFMTGKKMESGEPIVPGEYAGIQPSLQFDQKTSAFSRYLANKLNEGHVYRDRSTDYSEVKRQWSPMFIDYMLKSFGNTAARDVLAGIDLAAKDQQLAIYDWPIARRFVKEGNRGAVSQEIYYRLIGRQTGELDAQAKTFSDLLNGWHNTPEAMEFLRTLTPDSKAFVVLSAGPYRDDDKKLNPLINARAGMDVVRTMRSAIANNKLFDEEFPGDESKRVFLTPSQQMAIDHQLGNWMFDTMHNSMLAINARGWEGKPYIPHDVTYQALEQISPKVAQLLSEAFVRKQVYKMVENDPLWKQARDDILREGTSAIVSPYTTEMLIRGYEMGEIAARPRAKRQPANIEGPLP